MPVAYAWWTLPGVIDDLSAAVRAFPAWARWNGDGMRRYTLGVEEELMLLHPDSWEPAQSSDAVLPRLSGELARHVAPETHAAVLELNTGVCPGVEESIAELGALRSRLAAELDAMGLGVAA